MATRYRRIDDLSQPSEILDQGAFVVWTFNVLAIKSASDTFLEELHAIVAPAVTPVGVILGAKSRIPAGNGPTVLIRATGGPAAERTHNQISPPANPKPTAQITVRASESRAARTVAFQAYNALVAVRNQDITPSVIP